MSDVCAICQKSLSSRMSVELADGRCECLSCARVVLKQSMDTDREKINRMLVKNLLAHDSNKNDQDQSISDDEALPIAEVAPVVNKTVAGGVERNTVDAASQKESQIFSSLPLLAVEEVDLSGGSSGQAGRELAVLVNKFARERKSLINKIEQLEHTICSQQKTISDLTTDLSARTVEKNSADSSLMGVNSDSRTASKAPPIVSRKTDIRSIWEKSVLGINRNKRKLRKSNKKQPGSAKNLVLVPLCDKGEQKGAAFINGGRE